MVRFYQTSRFHTGWVRNGPSATPPGRSAPGGEADEIGRKTDIGPQTSAFGVRADALAYLMKCPNLARSRSTGKLFFTFPRAKPNAENPHVRFDERGGKTERCRTAQATEPLLDSILTATSSFLQTGMSSINADCRDDSHAACNRASTSFCKWLLHAARRKGSPIARTGS